MTDKVIPVLSAANFVIGMGAFLVIGILEPVAADLGATAAAAGSVMTVYAITYAILSPVLVALTGRMGRRRVVTAGMALFGAASAMAALMPDISSLAASRILAACGAGIMTPVAAAIAANLAAPDRRARSLAAVFFGLSLAQIVGIPFGSFLAYSIGWRWAFAVVAILAVPVTIAVWLVVPAGLKFQPTALRNLGAMLRNGPAILAIAITASFLGAIYTLLTYFTPLMSTQMGYGRDAIAALLLIFGLGAVIGNVVGGQLADRMGARRTLILLCGLQVLFMPVFSLLPLPNVALFAFVLIWSTAGWSFAAGQQLRLVTLTGDQAQVALSLNGACIYIGAALGSAVGGAVISGLGVQALGIVAGIGSAVALAHVIISIRLSG